MQRHALENHAWEVWRVSSDKRGVFRKAGDFKCWFRTKAVDRCIVGGGPAQFCRYWNAIFGVAGAGRRAGFEALGGLRDRPIRTCLSPRSEGPTPRDGQVFFS